MLIENESSENENFDREDNVDNMENMGNLENLESMVHFRDDSLEMKIEMEEFENSECIEPSIKLKEEEEDANLQYEGKFKYFI